MRYTQALLVSLAMSIAMQAPAQPSEPAPDSTLTIARMFDGPDLSGPRLQQPKFSPDGRYVTYLQGKADNKDQLDLWAFDTRSGKAKLLLDSRVLVGDNERLSPEEEARRERQRTAALRGIVEYSFSSNGKRLLVPLGGDLYLYDLAASGNAVRRLTTTPGYETDARFSPKGRYVSFIRDQNLYAIDLDTGQERALTTDGKGLVQNGVAEFIAQEEMDRDTGYWWSPDERRIAFTRIDDTPVREIERLEINADGTNIVRQRYPAAGTANTLVELKILELDSGRVIPVDLGNTDHYLARVDWFQDSRYVAVQRQSRDQKRLDLLKVDASTGTSRALLTETSPAWVELHNDLRFLKQRPAFIWASSRSGYRHLYLYDLEGQLIRPLTAGDWMVVGASGESGLVGVDEPKGLVYFLANQASPLERQVYVTSLDTKDANQVRRLSSEAGWHDAKLLPGGKHYLDQWSSPEQPPTASLRSVDGKVRSWLVRNALDGTHPYHPYLPNHPRETYGSLTASDGQALYYRLTQPNHLEPGKRYPVIVDVYGGPHHQNVRREWMGGGYFRQILAQQGFVVFTLDNRGSGSRGAAFDTAIYRRLGKLEIEDQLRGVEFLKSLPFVDPERIGVMGWSYGGYMTLMALTTTTAFKAGVAGAPVTDWRLYDTHYTERYLGMPDAPGNTYEQSGVLAHADSLHGELLLVHGMADDNVLFTHSTLLMQRLQSQGRQFELMTYPGSKHALTRFPLTGKHFYQLALEFLKERL